MYRAASGVTLPCRELFPGQSNSVTELSRTLPASAPFCAKSSRRPRSAVRPPLPVSRRSGDPSVKRHRLLACERDRQSAAGAGDVKVAALPQPIAPPRAHPAPTPQEARAPPPVRSGPSRRSPPCSRRQLDHPHAVLAVRHHRGPRTGLAVDQKVTLEPELPATVPEAHPIRAEQQSEPEMIQPADPLARRDLRRQQRSTRGGRQQCAIRIGVRRLDSQANLQRSVGVVHNPAAASSG
ncbi:hypothetical protein Kfla_4683 [Kribbella flavida DSM 17836]|uniref:Uncharacterized protein n=1 Tax=Kribbella flavida (strain DSM 17836 / JCM 10339 / NBRC 14399) TaxID=479435 RepID=D2PZ92_KRIFD|nr:hypothetical protein Kfla_4683 [Kribbella flavida DSM 17836]